jgi:CRP/FNR family transcriptional regulator, cyclic AMP receptor protein
MPEFTFEVSGLAETAFSKGDILLQEGKRGDAVFVLKEGAVKVTTAGRELCKVNVPLAIFGEISVLLDSDASATVSAETDCKCYVIRDFVGFLRNHPEAGLHVARVMAGRIVNMNNTFVEIKDQLAKATKNSESSKSNSKVLELLAKMDQFWGQELWGSPRK